MSIQIKSKKIATFVGLAAIAGVAQSSGVAVAATDACTTSNPDATNVGNDVCEVTFLTSPSSVFAVPAGVNAMQALLVGGGSGAVPGYTGGGGEVKVVNLATTGDLTIEVAVTPAAGEGGKISKITQSGTDYIANGGQLNNTDPASAGAGGPAGQDKGINSVGEVGDQKNMPSINGGSGLVVEDIEGATLFSGVTDCYGGGGSGGNYISNGPSIVGAWLGISSCGGGTTSVNIGTDVWASVEPLANSGGGAGGFPSGWDPRAGSSGRVVLRYTFEEKVEDEGTEELADTGSSNTTLPLIAGLMLVAAGAIALKRRTN